jgi:hypothetical protein
VEPNHINVLIRLVYCVILYVGVLGHTSFHDHERPQDLRLDFSLTGTHCVCPCWYIYQLGDTSCFIHTTYQWEGSYNQQAKRKGCSTGKKRERINCFSLRCYLATPFFILGTWLLWVLVPRFGTTAMRIRPTNV